MDTPTGMQIIQIDGKIGLKINHVVIMMSPDDAEAVGHDMIINAAELKAEIEAAKEG